ncbi:MAG: MotE family protein [Candidatus Adiutrix sp.]
MAFSTKNNSVAATKQPNKTGASQGKSPIPTGAPKKGRKGPPAVSPPPIKAKTPWPVMQLAGVLLLLKIFLGVYFVFGPSQPPADSMAAQLEQMEAKLAAETLGEPESNRSLGHGLASSFNNYLAMAAAAVSPSSAQATASTLPASSVAVNAMASGALMVIGSQNQAAGLAENAISSIPLPPNSSDLLAPAAQMSPPSSPPTAGGQAPATSGDLGALATLRAREINLAQQEAMLNSKSEALSTLEAELNRRLMTIEATRTDIENMTKRNEDILAEQKALREEQRKDDEALKDARIQHLVVAYRGMKPEQAGNLVNSLDDDVAVAILAAMPGRNAGQILAFVVPDKAARLTRAISERRIDPNILLDDGQNAFE